MGGKTTAGTITGVSTLPATVYTPLNCTTTVDFQDGEATEIDTTCLSDLVETSTAGLATSAGLELSLNVNFQDAGYLILEAAKASGAIIGFEVEFAPDVNAVPAQTKGDVFVYEGWVKTLPWNASTKAAITGSASVKITKVVSHTAPVTT